MQKKFRQTRHEYAADARAAGLPSRCIGADQSECHVAEGNHPGIANKDRQRNHHDHVDKRLGQYPFQFSVPRQMHDGANSGEDGNEPKSREERPHSPRNQMRSPVARGANKPCGRKKRTRITSP